jgi:hypothetical protein
MLLDFNIECHQSQLGALVGSKSFVESFVVEVLHKDLGPIFNLLTDFETAFGMLLLGYAPTCFVQCFHFQLFCNA